MVYLTAFSLGDEYHRLSRVHDFFADLLHFSGDHLLDWNLSQSMQFPVAQPVLMSGCHYIHPFAYDVRNAPPKDLVKIFHSIKTSHLLLVIAFLLFRQKS